LTTAPTTDETVTTSGVAPREGMFRELLTIHSYLRRDLQTVRRLARDARDGLSPQTILAEIRNLETNSPLWPAPAVLGLAPLAPRCRQSEPYLARRLL
jgi:hypothetical protein